MGDTQTHLKKPSGVVTCKKFFTGKGRSPALRIYEISRSNVGKAIYYRETWVDTQ